MKHNDRNADNNNIYSVSLSAEIVRMHYENVEHPSIYAAEDIIDKL